MKRNIISKVKKFVLATTFCSVLLVGGSVKAFADDNSGKTVIYSRATAPTIKYGDRYDMELDNDQTTYYKLEITEKTKIKLKGRCENGHFLLTSAYGYELFNSDGIDKHDYDDETDPETGNRYVVWHTDKTFILSTGTYYVGFTTTFYYYAHIDYAYFRVYKLDMTDFEKLSERTASDISFDNVAKISEVEKLVTSQKSDKDVKGSTYTLLQAKGSAKGKNAIKISWKKIKQAKNYTIYGNKCGKSNKYKKIATVKKNSFIEKKLKKGTYYKYIVVANTSSHVIAVSKTVHVATKGGKATNYKKVKAPKIVKVRVNKSKKVKAKAIKESAKTRNHRFIAYESSDVRVATVGKNGVIKGIHKGSCYVCAYAQDGKMAKIKVKVTE